MVWIVFYLDGGGERRRGHVFSPSLFPPIPIHPHLPRSSENTELTTSQRDNSGSCTGVPPLDNVSKTDDKQFGVEHQNQRVLFRSTRGKNWNKSPNYVNKHNSWSVDNPSKSNFQWHTTDWQTDTVGRSLNDHRGPNTLWTVIIVFLTSRLSSFPCLPWSPPYSLVLLVPRGRWDRGNGTKNHDWTDQREKRPMGKSLDTVRKASQDNNRRTTITKPNNYNYIT